MIPVYYEVKGIHTKIKRPENFGIADALEDALFAKSVNLALVIENELCPYPKSLLARGYKSAYMELKSSE